MDKKQILNFIEKVLQNMPSDWLRLTTHRLDIYNESQAKTEFLEEFDKLAQNDNSGEVALNQLPTAYDYIRLGHPLSSVLEWAVSKLIGSRADRVISFSSQVAPILAVLRKNLLDNKSTRIVYQNSLPESFNSALYQEVYGYQFELQEISNLEDVLSSEAKTVYISHDHLSGSTDIPQQIDFYVHIDEQLGSIVIVNGENENYISEIQHFRRRETIAMTPDDCHKKLQQLTGATVISTDNGDRASNQKSVETCIRQITNTDVQPLIGSSGLSVQYAIMMGLIDHANESHPQKDIRFLVPPNCYGGTNDQARRIAACHEKVEIWDLLVDRENDMVQSIDSLLDKAANEDAIAYIIVEIPTNPRVEVPHLKDLKTVLSKQREGANEPVFIVDQTFCPNVRCLGESDTLSGVNAISYVSGSKFPSGGKCTAGYCTANEHAAHLMSKISTHLKACDNEATDLHMAILAEQIPSMNQRIDQAYHYTRDFVNFIEKSLPEAKINFISEELVALDFKPSVFSLDLPTKGETEEAREAYKRALNLKLIDMMITQIPEESKYCVSYGQLKGCYWTIPATSTQGTTKEGDKDYIARVALSGNMDLERHKQVFSAFVESL